MHHTSIRVIERNDYSAHRWKRVAVSNDQGIHISVPLLFRLTPLVSVSLDAISIFHRVILNLIRCINVL